MGDFVKQNKDDFIIEDAAIIEDDFIAFEIDKEFEIGPSTNVQYEIFSKDPILPTPKFQEYNDEDDEPIPIRIKRRDINPDVEDLIFQISGTTIKKDVFIEDEGRLGVEVFMHGNLETGETVCVQMRGYTPYFYLTIPEQWEKGITNSELKRRHKNFFDTLIKDLKNKGEKEFPFNEVSSYHIEYHHPTTGFRNGEKIPAIKFKFYTLNAFYRFKHGLEQMYPPPTESDIKKGIYKNDKMLCEHSIPQEIKFENHYSFTYNGWIKLTKGSYSILETENRAMYNFYTYSLEKLNAKDDIADGLMESIDIEAIRADGKNAMPDATNPEDCISSIGIALESILGSFERIYYIFTWGGPVDIPTHDRNGKPIPKRKIVMKVYKDEAEMLTNWVRWRRSKKISPDCTIGWNIFGFDLGYLATRMLILDGISEDVKEWGRLVGYETKIKDSSIESKAIAYGSYKLTPSPGNIFVDYLIRFQRDVTLRLPSYQLGNVSKHFINKEKDDIHYSEIKPMFYGNSEQRGLLCAYNLQDTDLVLDLLHHCKDWAKMTNVCRVNGIDMNMISRGQQIRVYAGYHKNALDNDYIMWRPHYHPILDLPIVEDPYLWSEKGESEKNRAERRFENKGDINYLIDFLYKYLNIKGEEPILSQVSVDENGEKTEKIINKNDKTLGAIKTRESKDIKVYGRDINPLGGKKPGSPEGLLGTRNMTVEEIEKLSRKKQRYKYEITNDNKMKSTPIIGKNAKKDSNEKSEESEKGFSGGFVMEPDPGLHENVVIEDFNALYPNIMMSFGLDPASLVLDPRFASCPGVIYLKIRINENREFLIAQGSQTVTQDGQKITQAFQGVITKHTKTLVNNRKIAQACMESYKNRIDIVRKKLTETLELPQDTKMDVAIKVAKEYVSKNSDIVVNYHDIVKITKSILEEEYDIIKQWIGRDIPIDESLMDAARMEISSTNDNKKKKCLEVSIKVCEKYLRDLATLERDAANQMETDKSSKPVAVLLELAKIYEAEVTNYNSNQNELKVGANSTFGFLGAGGRPKYSENGTIMRRGMIQVMPISACVTYIGRKTIEAAKNMVEEMYPGSKVIYADTDSLFIVLPENIIPKGIEGLNETFKIAPKIADMITSRVTEHVEGITGIKGISTMRIVHEKSARFIIMYSAKCYALDKYEKPYPADPGKLEIKGLSFSKRDCCKFVSVTCKNALDTILRKGKLEEAKEYIRTRLKDLLDGKVTAEDLKIYKKISKKLQDTPIVTKNQKIISKQSTGNLFEDLGLKVMDKKLKDRELKTKKLSKKSQEENNISHLHLAEKINQRKPGLGPKSGESVQYLFVDLGPESKDEKNEEYYKENYVKCGKGYIEDFDYVKENKMKIDYLWYLENQCKSNICLLFKPLMEDPKILLRDSIKEQSRIQCGMKRGTNILDQMNQFYSKKTKLS